MVVVVVLSKIVVDILGYNCGDGCVVIAVTVISTRQLLRVCVGMVVA